MCFSVAKLEVAKLQSLSPIQSKGKAKELLCFIWE